MKYGEHHEHDKYGRHGGEHGGEGHRHCGAQTFRRGRALDFLRMLNVKRATLAKQLEQPELQAIHQIIIGELRAIDLVRNEFIELFELYEKPDAEKNEERIVQPSEDLTD